VVGSQPATLQLRYLQTLTEIAAEKNSTIIFPLPIDILAGLLNLTGRQDGRDGVETPVASPPGRL
jgi:hypothetical protein